MKRFSLTTLSLGLLVSVFVCGAVTTAAGFFGLIYPVLSLQLLLPLFFFILLIVNVAPLFASLQRNEKILTVLLIVVWLLHFLGVLVPETGFDAVWYHLPIAQQFVQQHRIVYLPAYYQSLNPQFSDLIFLLGFQVLGVFGAKLIAYLFGVSLVLYSYQLSRTVLDRFWSLIVVLLISTFQVVAWQSSSFYVDVAKATWEIGALWIALRFTKQRWALCFSSLLLGASLASKLFSVFLVPVFLTIKKFWRYIPLAFIVALPFYLFTYQHSGNAFYSFQLHTNKLSEIGGQSSLISFLLQRTFTLPSSLTQLTLFSRDYTTLLFLVFFPIFLFSLRKMWGSAPLRMLFIFSCFQYLIWWYVPPFSTRYALSGFITLSLLYIWSIQQFLKHKPAYATSLYLSICVAVLLNILPRVVPLHRTFVYFWERQPLPTYLRQFYDGNIDTPLKKWYGLNR